MDAAPDFRRSLWSSPPRSGRRFGGLSAWFSQLRSQFALSFSDATSNAWHSWTSCSATDPHFPRRKSSINECWPVDPTEAAEKAEQFLKERSLSSYYDDVALKGLQLAQMDLDREVLDVSRLLRIRDTVVEFTSDLSDQTDHEPIDGQATDDVEAVAAVEQVATKPAYSDLAVLQAVDLKPEWTGENPILCIAGRTPLDEAAAVMMSHLCKVHGLSARVEGSDALSTANIFGLDVNGVSIVCLSYLSSANSVHMRYAVRRLRRKVPRAKIVLAVWMSGEQSDAALDSAKADAIVVSLREAVRLCIDEASVKNAIAGVESPTAVALNSA